jgi:hypothetical protein
MNLRLKILGLLLLALVALFAIPYGITRYLIQRPNPPLVEQPKLKDPVLVSSAPYEIAEGFVFDLAQGWKLVRHSPDQAVDRYRFEPEHEVAVFTISVYQAQGFTDFPDVIQRRYGNGFISNAESITFNGFEAVRVSSGFDSTGTSSDVIVKIGEDQYLSLYGIHNPDGENGSRINQEIDFMQTSLQLTE